MASKITFVHAPNILYEQNYGVTLTPLWAYTLAAHLPDGWDSEVFDTEIDGDLATLGPTDVFAFSGMNKDMETVRAAHDVLRAKHPNAIFIIGGPMTWAMDKEGKLSLLEYFDHIFILDGEKTLPDFLEKVASGRRDEAKKVTRADRFPISQSKPVEFELFRPNARKYYGALVEVSRGCPFLCEFCDVRVLPGNNRANNKSPEIIVQELDEYYKMGIRQFQFVCDNFIGDLKWANRCVDAILEWQERTGAQISIFTWLTINLYKYDELMQKMRKAGFSILYIGIESVNHNSLLETAKMQNDKTELDIVVFHIQTFGFVIIPGFIFGFDSDTETVFSDTLDFYVSTGLIGGEPSFLVALAGTPLYSRMQRSGRLVEPDDEDVVVRKGNVGLEYAIQTNIRYLLDADFLARGFVDFMRTYNSADWQFRRYENHLRIIDEGGNHIAGSSDTGYGSPVEYFRFQLANPENRRMLFKRLWWIFRRPSVVAAILKAMLLTRKMSRRFGGLEFHFNYWVYVWTNMGMKHEDLTEEHVQVTSVPEDYDFSKFALSEVKADAREAVSRGDEKSAQQARFTNQALQKILNKTSQRSTAASA